MDDVYRNGEKYHDPTAGKAITKVIRDKEYEREGQRLSRIKALIPILRGVAELAGFDIGGRILLIDRETGKEYR